LPWIWEVSTPQSLQFSRTHRISGGALEAPGSSGYLR
jgi:hypothetical protein